MSEFGKMVRQPAVRLAFGAAAFLDLVAPAAAAAQATPIPGCIDPAQLNAGVNGCYCVEDVNPQTRRTQEHWRLVANGSVSKTACSPNVFQAQIESCNPGETGVNGNCRCEPNPWGGFEYLTTVPGTDGKQVKASCDGKPSMIYPAEYGIVRFTALTPEQQAAKWEAERQEMLRQQAIQAQKDAETLAQAKAAYNASSQPAATPLVVTAEEVQKYENYKKQQKNNQAPRNNASNAGQASGNESDGSLPVIGIGAVGLAIAGFYLWATTAGQDKYGGKMSDGSSISLKKACRAGNHGLEAMIGNLTDWR